MRRRCRRRWTRWCSGTRCCARVFVSCEGQAEQVIEAAGGFALRSVDLSQYAPEQRESELREQLRQEGAERFDLSRGPLIRGRLLRPGRARARAAGDDASHRLGWLVDGDPVTGAGAAVRGVPAGAQRSAAGRLPIQYADYAQWQRQWLSGERLQEQLQYWQEHLRGAPALLELPTDRARPAVQSYRGASVSFALPDAAERAVAQALRSVTG